MANVLSENNSRENSCAKSILKRRSFRKTDTLNVSKSRDKDKKVAFHRVKSIINYNPNNIIKKEKEKSKDKDKDKDKS